MTTRERLLQASFGLTLGEAESSHLVVEIPGAAAHKEVLYMSEAVQVTF